MRVHLSFAPDVLLNLAAGEHLARVRRQESHDLELLGGQVRRPAAHEHLVLVEAHFQIPDGHRSVAGRAAGELDGVLVAADMGLDAQDELGGVEGLGHVVVAPGPKPDGLVHDVVFRR